MDVNDPVDPDGVDRPAADPEVETSPRSRRSFLVGGTVAAAAAVGVLAAAEPADAAGGSPLLIGRGNAGTSGDPATLLFDSAFEIANQGAMLGIQVETEDAAAITASSEGGVGLRATSDTAVGVIGVSTSSAGGQFTSTTGSPLQLRQNSAVTVPPTTGFWSAGQFLLREGHVWYCFAAGTGTASRWVRLSSTFVPLDTPVRCYDSRPGEVPTSVVKGRMTSGSERVIDVRVGGGVPSNVSAVLLNITAVQTNDSGWLAVFKNGITFPGTSNLNWSAPGTTIANNATTKVDAGGSCRLRCAGDTHVLVDVFGYYV